MLGQIGLGEKCQPILDCSLPRGADWLLIDTEYHFVKEQFGKLVMTLLDSFSK